MWTGIDDNESERAVRAAMDAGITTFDTAEVYGNGHSEKILGQSHRQPTGNEVQILSFKGLFQPPASMIRPSPPASGPSGTWAPIISICIRSTGRRDPSAPGRSPLEETMRALTDSQGSQGKIRAIGVSNFSLDQLKAISEHRTRRKPATALFALLAPCGKRDAGLVPGQPGHHPGIFAHGPGPADRKIRSGSPLREG